MTGGPCVRCGATPAEPRSSDGLLVCEQCALETAATLETPSERRGPPRAGDTLDRYQILDELGRGGMAVVYRARQQGLERDVALKVLRSEFAAPAQIERFMREAQAVARLSHPNIVPVHDVGEAAGNHYLVMELVEGTTLDQEIRTGDLDVRTAATCVRDVARALHYAHEQGVIHRDVKPANILLAPDGTPRVADFGLARVEGGAGITAEGTAIGTPAYMAPEQAAGEGDRIGPRTDVYACGAVLYECLTGSPPFSGSSVLEILRHVQLHAPERITTLQPQVPADLAVVSEKALEKAPGDRYPTAAAFADDLDAFLDHRPIRARRIGAVGRIQRAMKRRPAAAVAIVAVLLAIVATVAALSVVAGGGPEGVTEADRRRASERYRVALRSMEELKQARLAGDAGGATKALTAAETALADALRADPLFDLAFLARARCHQQAGRIVDALTDYSRALELNPDLSDALYERARLRFHRHFSTQVGLGMQDAVEMAAIRADLGRLRAGARGEREHAIAAMLHLMAAEFDLAIAESTKALSLNEYFVDGYLLRGAARTARGYIERGLRREPKALQQLELALKDYELAQARGATIIDALGGRSQVLAGLWRTDEALADVARLIELAPADAGPLLLRARLEMLRGKRDQALEDLAAAQHIEGETAGMRLARSIVLLVPAFAFVTQSKFGDGPPPTFVPADLIRARADLDWVIQHAPSHTIARFYRAVALSAQLNLPASARDLHLFVRQSSDRSAFGQAARYWLQALGPVAADAFPDKPAALWQALESVGEADDLLSRGRDTKAAEVCQAAIAGLGRGLAGDDPWLREVEDQVQQRAHYALARVHARQAAEPAGPGRDAALRQALDHLNLAIVHGYADLKQLQQDLDLRVLSESRDYKRAISRLSGE